MITDLYYIDIIREIVLHGDVVKTRNAVTTSLCNLNTIQFEHTPLVTVRKTAIWLALREMEWFMSGETKCPKKLLKWWSEQLHSDQHYYGGYSEQFRHAGGDLFNFDQIHYILDGLRSNPNSRRLCMTTWNPWDMAHITELNANPKTPTCCHSSFVQFFVRSGKLNMMSYQRSADVLLGVPHNWIQSWALLLYFAYHAGLDVGWMRWQFGDAHIYHELSHEQTVNLMLQCTPGNEKNSFTLKYQPKFSFERTPSFNVDDFVLDGVVPEPMVLSKPKLL